MSQSINNPILDPNINVSQSQINSNVNNAKLDQNIKSNVINPIVDNTIFKYSYLDVNDYINSIIIPDSIIVEDNNIINNSKIVEPIHLTTEVFKNNFTNISKPLHLQFYKLTKNQLLMKNGLVEKKFKPNCNLQLYKDIENNNNIKTSFIQSIKINLDYGFKNMVMDKFIINDKLNMFGTQIMKFMHDQLDVEKVEHNLLKFIFIKYGKSAKFELDISVQSKTLIEFIDLANSILLESFNITTKNINDYTTYVNNLIAKLDVKPLPYVFLNDKGENIIINLDTLAESKWLELIKINNKKYEEVAPIAPNPIPVELFNADNNMDLDINLLGFESPAVKQLEKKRKLNYNIKEAPLASKINIPVVAPPVPIIVPAKVSSKNPKHFSKNQKQFNKNYSESIESGVPAKLAPAKLAPAKLVPAKLAPKIKLVPKPVPKPLPKHESKAIVNKSSNNSTGKSDSTANSSTVNSSQGLFGPKFANFIKSGIEYFLDCSPTSSNEGRP